MSSPFKFWLRYALVDVSWYAGGKVKMTLQFHVAFKEIKNEFDMSNMATNAHKGIFGTKVGRRGHE